MTRSREARKRQAGMLQEAGGDGAGRVGVGRAGQADLEQAVEIVTDAKTQYPSACNSVETLLVHEVRPARGPREAVRHAGPCC